MHDAAASSLRIGLLNWLSAINAIITREITTRFSGGSLGHAWAIIIPVSWIFAIAFFFRWIGRDAPISVSLPVFLATGMLPYLIFRQIITSMMRSLRSNRHLATVGPIKAEDIFTATAILEILNAILISAVVFGLLSLWSDLPTPTSALWSVWGFALACGLGISFGRFAAILSVSSDSAMRLVPILLRPFFWLSGIFFVSTELPQWMLNWLWYNPLLHAIEIIRSGFVPGFSSTFANSLVPVLTIALLYAASRGLEATLESKSGSGTLAV